MADLSVNIGDLKLCNPVMTASGTFGYGKEFEDFVDLEKDWWYHCKKGLPFIIVRVILTHAWQKPLWGCLMR